MMSNFNESSESSHLPSEIEGSRRLKGQTASQGTMLRKQMLKKVMNKRNVDRMATFKQHLTLDLTSVLTARMSRL